MPLSEDEQRILHEIERRFYEHDPEYAKTIESTTLYRALGRNCKWAAFGFVLGLVLLLVSFASSLILGVVGFLVMLGCAFFFERNLRKMGRASWQEFSEAMRARGGPLGETGRKLRDRFKRDE